MVLLTMTPVMVEALEKLKILEKVGSTKEVQATAEGRLKHDNEGLDGLTTNGEGAVDAGQQEKELLGETAEAKMAGDRQNARNPTLSNPRAGNPLSHGQVIDLWKKLKAHEISPNSLENLLRGARVYTPPFKAKSEKTAEYQALMARLRREEEARSYQRMVNPPPPAETFAQRFPHSSAAHAFASSQQPLSTEANEDEVTYADVDRQVALIFNVLISIVACAAAIWIAAKWWSTPARLALSLSGSLLVGIAEVVVYSGYIRRVGDAKGKEKSIKEVKEVVNTWIVGGGVDDEPDDIAGDIADKSVAIKPNDVQVKARKRK